MRARGQLPRPKTPAGSSPGLAQRHVAQSWSSFSAFSREAVLSHILPSLVNSRDSTQKPRMSPSSNRFQPLDHDIDIGTTNSLNASANATRWERALAIDPTAPDPTVFRSILHFDFEGRASFGARALERYRQLGMQGRLVRSLKRHLPSKSFVTTEVEGRSYRLEELVGGILRTLRERANAHFECDVTRVLLGRPARFSEDPSDDALAEARLVEAARLAGFTQIEVCPEPLAAAYDFQEHLSTPKLVMI